MADTDADNGEGKKVIVVIFFYFFSFGQSAGGTRELARARIDLLCQQLSNSTQKETAANSSKVPSTYYYFVLQI